LGFGVGGSAGAAVTAGAGLKICGNPPQPRYLTCAADYYFRKGLAWISERLKNPHVAEKL
jgi:hypothetical protein